MSKIELRSTISAAVINREGKLLLLKRAANKKHYPNVWNIIAGWLPEDKKPEEHVFTEISEELSVDSKILLGPIMWQFYRPEKNLVIKDYTFLMEVSEPEKIKIDREHSKYEWINLEDIDKYETFDNITENLHYLGATKSEQPFRVLYTNYKNETKWRNIIPRNYFYGETEYHKGKRWLLECFDTDKEDKRTYAVEDISIFIPPIYK